MNKKLISGILALGVCLSLASCDALADIPIYGDILTNIGNKLPDVPVIGDLISGNSSEDENSGEDEYDVVNAADALYGNYVDQDYETRTDYEVPNTFMYVGAEYTVTWSVDVTEGIKVIAGETTTKIDVDENAQADINYILTAVVEAPNGETATVEFERIVLQALAFAPEGITAKPVEGKAYKLYVYQSNKKADCYFTGMMSGYYYATSEAYEEGADLYVEYVEGSTTEFYISFESSVDGKQYLTIEEAWNAKNSYWTFNPLIKGEATTKFTYSEEYKTIVTTVPSRSAANNEDQNAPQDSTTTVYLGNYKTYMTFNVTDVKEIATEGNNIGNLVEMVDKGSFSAEEKVAFEKDALALTEKYVGDATVDLRLLGDRYKDVVISWTENSDNLSIADGVLTITAPTAETTVKLTATITCGSVTDTKEIEIVLAPAVNVPADSVITIPQANEIGAAQATGGYTTDKYYVVGTVSKIANTTYGNLYIKDAQGNELYVYGTYDADGTNRFDAMDPQPKVGDTVKLYSTVGNYNGDPQMKNAWIVELTPGEGGEVTPPATDLPAADSTLTVADVLKHGATFEHNTYSEGKYYVTATVKEVYNAQYGNMYVTDAEGNQLTVYGTYDATGDNRYDKMESKPVAGDTVKLYGIIGQYNGTPQMKNAWIIEFTAGEGGEGGEVTPPATDLPAADSTLTVADVLKHGATFEHNTYSEGKYYVTATVKEVYNATYGNMYVTDAAGNQLTVYGTYDATGDNRYDKMESKPVAGDTVKLYGIIGQYNGTPQMKNAWIIEFTPAEGGNEGGEVTPPATDLPAADSTLTVADVLKHGATFEHNTYSEGKYYVTATVKEVYNAQYGNMYVTDAEGNQLTVYGTYDATGDNRYDKMESKPVAGDTVKLYGIIGQYSGTPQMKNAWIIEFTPAEGGNEGGEVTPPPVEEVGTKYTFADYEAGTQYAMDEEHKLDDTVTVITSDAHFTTQLRLYDSTSHDSIAIIKSAKVINQITLNAGNKEATLNVYGSTDGENWTLIEGIATAEAYADHVVEIANSAYTYLKLDADGAQIRVASMTLVFAAPAEAESNGFVASELGLENAAEFTTYTDGNVTFTAAVNDGTNSPKYYSSGSAIRFYAQNSFTISVAEGYKITQITIKAAGNYVAEDNCAFTNATATGLGSGEVVIVPVDGASDVVLTYTKTSGNFRIAEIIVVTEAI